MRLSSRAMRRPSLFVDHIRKLAASSLGCQAQGDEPFPTQSFSKRMFLEAGSQSNESYRFSAGRAPLFRVRASDISILSTPDEFYSKLLELAESAQRRVSLASLYLGTAKQERALVTLLKDRCDAQSQRDDTSLPGRSSQSKMVVNIILDRNRGTRPDITYHDDEDGNRVKTVGESSASILKNAVENSAPGTFNLGLFDMPIKEDDTFTRFALPRLGARYNELLHTFHLKAYVFDDTVIMSGANLSKDYFTNRQDRYWVFKSAELADFYHDLLQALYDASHKYDCGARTASEPFLPFSHYEDLRLRINNLMRPDDTVEQSFIDGDNSDEWAFVRPSIQCSSLGFRDDEKMTLAMFDQLDNFTNGLRARGSHIGKQQESSDGFKGDVFQTAWLSTGYLNLHEAYSSRLLAMNTLPFRVLAAAPSANGFFTARGIAGALPMAYSLFQKRLHRDATKREMYSIDRLHLLEYEREGWTYHAKGLWFLEERKVDTCSGSNPRNKTPRSKSGGGMTLIGSPNFGYRSVERDFESQLLVVTDNLELVREMQHELNENILQHCSNVDESTWKQGDRKLSWSPFSWKNGWWISPASRLVRYFM